MWLMAAKVAITDHLEMEKAKVLSAFSDSVFVGKTWLRESQIQEMSEKVRSNEDLSSVREHFNKLHIHKSMGYGARPLQCYMVTGQESRGTNGNTENLFKNRKGLVYCERCCILEKVTQRGCGVFLLLEILKIQLGAILSSI